MSFRIAHPPTAFTLQPKRAKPGKELSYLKWLHSLPCAVTGSRPVEAAHLSTANAFYGHMGRGKGQKADDRWALPLAPALHAKQHAGNEMAFWKWTGIDPHRLALVLHALWEQGASADYAAIIIEQHRRKDAA